MCRRDNVKDRTFRQYKTVLTYFIGYCELSGWNDVNVQVLQCYSVVIRRTGTHFVVCTA